VSVPTEGQTPLGPPASDPPARELWGYAVWGVVLLVILIPEVWAAGSKQKVWPTISGTVGHLEYMHDWVGLLVVAIIVWVVTEVVSYPTRPSALLGPSARQRRRTAGGRATARVQSSGEIPVLMLGAGALAVAVGSVLTAELDSSDLYALGYVLYGSIALLCAAVPCVIAFVWAKDVPFPTFFATLANLERRAHFVMVLVLIGLAILLVHLALYPWPNIFHILKGPHPTSP
jgi:hypothetical protein